MKRARLFGVLLAVVLAALSMLAVSGPADAEAPATAQTISGLDLHDGMITQVGSTYYLYGTEYACGFSWLDPSTRFCGFDVRTSTDKVHWSAPTPLFDPNGTNSWRGESWQATCVSVFGGGCFNPRMTQRGDGVWILWFNAPDDFRRTGANAYYALGCRGPAGPCGDQYAGGTTHKPALSICSGNGDFSIVEDGGTAYIACTMANQTMRIEQLDQWWTNGVGQGLSTIGGLGDVEAPAVFRSGGYLYLTYSDPNCGYCSGTGTSYLYSTNGMLGTWYRGGKLSTTSCAGQPRSLSIVDGRFVEWIDQWRPDGAHNQTNAPIHLEPMNATGAAGLPTLTC
ncbi:family 43 glycosylhydrolase [Kutzneria sp. CA-103260]|uniref:family 43 glycosylhydrolase n=1 Tax=Kutzneria sp. CA-103260 TaxID=2802641 RepID=UPI001BAA3F73|nr:family 43 glycosylhydrolase [Kutzneria sp. CA-103260]QUQ63251.1 Glycosyl hydrolases family 43 [Kutzneria sp. CA-103260]